MNGIQKDDRGIVQIQASVPGVLENARGELLKMIDDAKKTGEKVMVCVDASGMESYSINRSRVKDGYDKLLSSGSVKIAYYNLKGPIVAVAKMMSMIFRSVGVFSDRKSAEKWLLKK